MEDTSKHTSSNITNTTLTSIAAPSLQGGRGESLLFGLIGHPLGHSFSRKFFTEKFADEGINAEYNNYEIPNAEQLLDVVRDNPNLCGLNCTIPHKQAIIPMLDELSDEARRIGAVNVIRISRQPEDLTTPQAKERGFYLKGFNSDIIGFTDSIKPLLKPHHKKALVLGTGGASKAICVGLEKMGIEWKYVSRRPAPGQFTYDDLTPAIIQEYSVIVNCSPVGMYPKVENAPALPYEAMTADNLLFDLVYNPLETTFMKRGAEYGATVKNGLEMLHLQALASWKFWNN